MKRNKTAFIFFAMIFLSGLCISLYPAFRTMKQRSEQYEAVEEYQSYVNLCKEESTEETSSSVNTPAREEIKITQFPALWEACCVYNQSLPNIQEDEISAEHIKEPALTLNEFGFDQKAFAYLNIPEANIIAPIYLGATMDNLEKGAAHLGFTTLPIGGKDSNCVICGHRTWSGAVTFEGLERLKAGDLVYVTNPWETLKYTVIDIKVIAANDIDEILIQPGQDLLTLFTCTRPATQRYLVICERRS